MSKSEPDGQMADEQQDLGRELAQVEGETVYPISERQAQSIPTNPDGTKCVGCTDMG